MKVIDLCWNTIVSLDTKYLWRYVSNDVTSPLEFVAAFTSEEVQVSGFV